jgi:hypothetical protein
MADLKRDMPPNAGPVQPDNDPAGGMRKSGSGAVKGGDNMRPGESAHDEKNSKADAQTNG